MITPEQLEQQVQTAASRREVYKNALIESSTDTILNTLDELTSLEKLNLNLITRVESFKYRALEELNSLAVKLNITDLNTPSPRLPDTCPPLETLRQISNNRNNLLQDIQKLNTVTNTIGESLNLVNKVTENQLDAKVAIQTLKTATSLASKTLPALPGAIGSLLSDLEDVVQQLTFDVEGKPRIPRIKTASATGLIYINTSQTIITNLISKVNIVDTVLSKCNQSITPIPAEILETISKLTPSITSSEGTLSGSSYKGFIFEIVEIPFRNTLTQRKAVAKNKFGVVLLETGLSFTTDPQTLIQELEFIIDRDNLKAN